MSNSKDFLFPSPEFIYGWIKLEEDFGRDEKSFREKTISRPSFH
jgi:hypothetical protein